MLDMSQVIFSTELKKSCSRSAVMIPCVMHFSRTWACRMLSFICYPRHTLTWIKSHVLWLVYCLQHHTTPHLRDKQLQIRVDPCLLSWIKYYFTGRPKYVKLRNCTVHLILWSVAPVHHRELHSPLSTSDSSPALSYATCRGFQMILQKQGVLGMDRRQGKAHFIHKMETKCA